MSKLVKCKACGNDVAKGSKCPSCGKDQRNFFSKHKFLTGIAVVVILVAVSGASKPKPTLVPVTAGAKPAVAQTSGNTTYRVGDTVKLADYQVKVNKVYVIQGTDGMLPAKGNEFLGVDCTIDNTSSAEQTISSMIMFKVVDKDGRSQDYSLLGQTASKGGQLDGAVGAGRKISGVYAVEVPEGTTGLQLEFDASLLSSGQQVVVQLN
jgi:hypothetical protein